MPAALPLAPPRRERPAVPGRAREPADRSATTALLRWRAWWLGHHLPRRQALALRLWPALLHASFPHGRLSGEPPGVAGLHYRQRWSSAARLLGLPPPRAVQRGRPVIDAVLALPTPDGLDTIALARPDARIEELGLAQDRLEIAQAVLASAGVPVRPALYTAARLLDDEEAGHRVAAFGALLAGRPSAEAWAALEVAARRPVDAGLAVRLAARAPSPFSALALLLMSLRPAPAPLSAVEGFLLQGQPARALADPDRFALRWAEQVEGLAGPLEQLHRTCLGAEAAGAPQLDPGALLALGRWLAARCTTAVCCARCRPERRLAGQLRAELLGPGLPRLLLPALGHALEALEQGRPLPLEPVRVGRAYEVRLPGGACLGRGRSPVQARVRALAVAAPARAALRGEAAVAAAVAGLDPTWRVVAQRLSRLPVERARLLVVEAGGGARPGPPHDLLNRGPERSLEFEGALEVSVGPGRRPSGRMLSAPEAVERVVRHALEPVAPLVLASRPESRPVAARLGQIGVLLRDPRLRAPAAVEAGGTVFVPGEGRLRRYRLDRFAARPRIYTPDPESPDLALGPGNRRVLSGLVQCKVTLAGPGTAAVLYADGAGAYLRERVPLGELEEHLREARAIVREARPRCALTLWLTDDVESLLRRTCRAERAAVVVGGALPRVEVSVGGQRFGAAGLPGWDQAAQALLAGWPPGAERRIGVGEVTATLGGLGAPPLLALWAAGVARRRLHTRISRASAAYREAAAGRMAR